MTDERRDEIAAMSAEEIERAERIGFRYIEMRQRIEALERALASAQAGWDNAVSEVASATVELNEVYALVTDLRAEIARLEAERDDYLQMVCDWRDGADVVVASRARADAAEAAVAPLREALRKIEEIGGRGVQMHSYPREMRAIAQTALATPTATTREGDEG